MAEVDSALSELRRAAKRLQKIDEDRVVAMRDRDAALRRAKAARATGAELEDASGLTPATISKALRRE